MMAEAEVEVVHYLIPKSEAEEGEGEGEEAEEGEVEQFLG
jgi:hypothetical protein